MEPNHQLNNVSDISDDEREEALIKYRIIQPFLQNIKTITIICEEQQLSRRTISRWIANYRKDGFIGLWVF
ncbi:MAG: helix-turn-helix domain-containing protein [Burkholderiales bacterium]|nr:helix-turn-helix domain-containing protein [Burkholderiales bacterium]